MSLKSKTLTGILWTFSQQFSVKGISFVVQIILARILMPEVYGLVAIVGIFVAIGRNLVDGGMTSSLIRTQDADQKDYSTVFFLNLMASFVLYAILFFCAPYISGFFEMPQLTALLRVYTLSFIIQALGNVQTTRLTKELNFKLQMYMQIPATICGGIVGIILAYNGFGVWSLVLMYLTTATVFMVQHWFRTDWRPDFVIDKNKLKHHFDFGYKVTLSGLVTTAYHHSYTLIIGKMFSATQLGFYNQANTLRMFPVQNLTTALRKVTYPVFSSIQDDNVRLKAMFRKITALVFFVVTPVMLYLVIVAEPLFRFLLTEKWLPAAPYFQVLALSAIVYPLSMYNLNIVLAKGRSDLHLKMELIKKLSSIMFLLLIIPFGIWGVIYAQAISMLIHAFVNTFFCGRLINYPVRNQIIDVFPIFLLCFVLTVIMFSLNVLFFSKFLENDLVLIITNFILYFALYLLCSKLLRFKELKELLKIGKQGFLKIRNK
ncbi:lipopolysaccharide biosynthesis protein [Eudoraea chungangensis]|uniref:lipopolysaccharide biosynthesis protein n=1 Tax=Eudoraea chungangensis TaxID=1481905 RepID=UPI0023EAB23E|nr:lipopolysaccharide biosynthesis protein [Eudoraea chungangensis]